MILWIVLAFAGICTAKQHYPSFANNIYYTVNDSTGIEGYDNGTILVVKSAGAEQTSIGSIVCIEVVNQTTAKKSSMYKLILYVFS